MIIWRRHQQPCKSTNRTDPKCGCLIYQEFRVNGKRFRRTLKTRNWQKALATARRAELHGHAHKTTQDTSTPTVQQAGERYLEDARTRGVKAPTLYKFGLLFRQMQNFADEKGLIFISDFDVDMLSQFRSSLPNSNFGMAKKWAEIKSFFRFVTKRRWLQENPAMELTPIRVSAPEIIPITDEEMENILKACSKPRTRALVLLLRYSGLRIRDAVTLRKDQVTDGQLVLRTTKTGSTVSCPLPPVVVEALQEIEHGSHYFWNGASQPKSAVGV